MFRKIKILMVIVMIVLITFLGSSLFAEGKKTILFHLKTGLKQDDAQICVAYNEIWAAMESGFSVDVLIDASAVNTYKRGFFGKDSLENYKLPEGMRQVLAHQFNIPIQKVPQVYGEYLTMLHNKGAVFYINSEMMITAGIARDENDMEKISAKFFKPISMKKIIELRTKADYYLAY
ncbi:MAG: hypothetical protein Q8P28_01595 [Deltaproteobacteria bacterium]|nr:hypothetical protein [Deltaproteobacteria bacterium]